MRVIFMGTPEFAVPSLKALAARHNVVLVVTRPDGASGRGKGARPSEVKVAAGELGLPVFQPSSLRGDAAEVLREAAPDVICVAAFGMLLPAEVLAIPALGCVNVHASLLPRYRGAAPIQRAILSGDEVTGVSIMRMEEGLDTGPYAAQRSVSIGSRYADELAEELAEVGAVMLVEVLESIADGGAVWIPQDESSASYAAKVLKDDVALLPELSVGEAFARVRAATRRAPARACVGGRELTVVRAHPIPAALGAGGVCVLDEGPALAFADGCLVLDVVRPAGKADMAGVDWIRGARLEPGASWWCTR